MHVSHSVVYNPQPKWCTCPAFLCAGGLPYGWVSTNKVFSQLKFLDLSQNNLGLDANGQQYRVTEVSQFVGHEVGLCHWHHRSYWHC